MIKKDINCHFASLNANSLIKSSNKQTQANYIRYLRLQNLDIICLQETHAGSTESIQSLNIHFQPNQAYWTKHVGIISFSQSYQISMVDTSEYYTSDRFQLCKVEHPLNYFNPFYILNLYAPASSAAERREFFEQLQSLLYNMYSQIDFDRLIIAGDFNYSHLRPHLLSGHTSFNWRQLLDMFFSNSMTMNNMCDIPTFQRMNGDTLVSSVIDYIYLGRQIHQTLTYTNIQRLNSYWSDHSILEITFTVGQSPTGPGLWRANPTYASHEALQKLIRQKVKQMLYNFSLHESLSAAHKWDRLKHAIRKVIQRYSFTYVNWRKKTIRSLEKDRNRILRTRPSDALKTQLIPPIDAQLGALQQELTDIAALKAGIRWREQGEKCAGFLKRLHHKRELQQQMTAVKRLDVGNTTVTVEASGMIDRTSDPNTMRNIVQGYYQQLYTVDTVDPDLIQSYLQTINFDSLVDTTDNEFLLADITIDDILEQVKRSPNQSSPGEDGLGYQYLRVIFHIKELQPLLIELFNDALLKSITPNSWKEIRVRLLPKKGDLTDLKNWRPISLINCDAKIFTRILNTRISTVATTIIQPSQTGFMHGRFIGDNGLLVHLIIQEGRYRNYPGIGMLLDQEKAYDRVNPQYLCQVLARFGFHPTLIQSISNLFFGNNVEINVNGFFSPSVNQQRGLRQGDPLSPILFNLALEPLLLAINQDTRIIGYQFQIQDEVFNIKTSAYADDICTFLSRPEDYQLLQLHLNQYATVSNAKFNQSKTEAFSINGQKDVVWQTLLAQENIHTFHTKHSVEPFRYLGYYMAYTISQRNYVQDKLLTTIKTSMNIYSVRNLSLRGRVTIVNTLILSKVWYCLRLLHPTQAFLKTVQSLIYGFVWKKKVPLVAYNQLCLPVYKGGLGVINPAKQVMNLQVRHLRHLFNTEENNSIVTQLLQYHMSLIANNNSCALLSFVVPSLRHHSLNHPTSILQSMYTAFDQFQFTMDFGSMSLKSVLQLPLKYMFRLLPDDHWLHRHKNFIASNFFHYDPQRQRLRILVENEYPIFPRLCKKLKTQLLTDQTVQLQSFVRPYITQLTPESVYNRIDTSIIDNFNTVPLWQKFQASQFRNLPNIGLTYTTMLLSKRSLQLFWSTTMLLQARTVWYRVLSNKVPTTVYLHKIGTVNSSICRLCHEANDTFEHFLVSCSFKLDIWFAILSQYLIEFPLDETSIYSFLRFLELPSQIKKSQSDKCYTIFSTTLWFIWIYYWQYIIDNVPFQHDVILSKIQTQVNILIDRPQFD